MSEPIRIGGVEVPPGTRQWIQVPVSRRASGAEVSLPVEVVSGRSPGPRLFVCAAVHGDEINGVEIIRRLLKRGALRSLKGTLIAVPVVNVFGFVSLSRYLPDRRDLNRSFPGSPRGSLAARLADTFLNEIVGNATHGIDLHTGALHRTNLPQVRACLDDPETDRVARAFGVPVILNSNLRDGSLRQEVLERKVPMLLYEGGEALRFDEWAIRAGERGVLGVMRALGMLPQRTSARALPAPMIAEGSRWVRAPQGGIVRGSVKLGDRVAAGQVLAHVADPLGTEESDVLAPGAGLVIGRSALPVVNEGDAIYHIATFERLADAASTIEEFQAGLA